MKPIHLEIIKKVQGCLSIIDHNYVSDDLITLFGDDPDVEIIREKVKNFNHLISNMNDKEIENLMMNKDFETEVWPLISYCNN